MWYIILLAVHLLICLLIFAGIHTHALKVHKYMFFVALLLPFWGPVLILVLHFQIAFDADDALDVGVEKMKLESELYKSITVDEKKVAATTVPIEEALVVNSARERRSIIMDVLNDDPKEYISFLQKASNNDDTEVVHYAVTAMVEISTENDALLQQYEKQYAEDPEDSKVLKQYADFLWHCLSQKLMQGQVETLNRDRFATLIQKKIAVNGEVEDYARAVENDLRRGQYALVARTLEDMGAHYPLSEEYYLLRLQYLASTGKGDELHALLREIDEREVFLSSKAKEVLAFWKS